MNIFDLSTENSTYGDSSNFPYFDPELVTENAINTLTNYEHQIEMGILEIERAINISTNMNVVMLTLESSHDTDSINIYNIVKTTTNTLLDIDVMGDNVLTKEGAIESIRNFLKKLWEKIKAGFNWVFEKISQFFKWITSWFKSDDSEKLNEATKVMSERDTLVAEAEKNRELKVKTEENEKIKKEKESYENMQREISVNIRGIDIELVIDDAVIKEIVFLKSKYRMKTHISITNYSDYKMANIDFNISKFTEIIKGRIPPLCRIMYISNVKDEINVLDLLSPVADGYKPILRGSDNLHDMIVLFGKHFNKKFLDNIFLRPGDTEMVFKSTDETIRKENDILVGKMSENGMLDMYFKNATKNNFFLGLGDNRDGLTYFTLHVRSDFKNIKWRTDNLISVLAASEQLIKNDSFGLDKHITILKKIVDDRLINPLRDATKAINEGKHQSDGETIKKFLQSSINLPNIVSTFCSDVSTLLKTQIEINKEALLQAKSTDDSKRLNNNMIDGALNSAKRSY